MSTSPRRSATRERARTKAPVGPAFPVIEAKLSVPPARPGLVVRQELVDRLRGSRDAPVVTVIAPSGYGKTTLLAQWAEADGRPVVWLTVDEQDNDLATLLTYLAVGLDRVRPIDQGIIAALASPSGPVLSSVLPRLGAALRTFDPPVLFMLDDAHLIIDPLCLDAVDALTDQLPAGSQLALGCQTSPAMHLPQLRAHGRLFEIGVADLAFGRGDALALLRAADVDLPVAEVDEIVAQTEGWAAGLHLASLSVRAGGTAMTSERFTGRDRFVADYLREEILERLPVKDLRFLIRTSVLDRMCAPLCDHVTGTKGSAATLGRLEEASLFLVPLDRHREWYRYHTLFRDALLAELDRREPGQAGELQRRAADWHERHGTPEIAVEYRLAAGDDQGAARLVLLTAQPMYRSGRVATGVRWFEWFETHGTLEGHAPLAVLAGWLHAMLGDDPRATRWTAAAERSSFQGPMPDGTPSIDSWIALLRALRCVDGVTRMREDAERAFAEIPPTSFFHATAHTLMGIAVMLCGAAGGEAHIEEGADLGEATMAYPLATLSMGLLAASRAARGDWAGTEAILERAARILSVARLDGYWTPGLIHALSARVALRRGDRETAQAELSQAHRLRPVLTHAIPWNAVLVRLELIRAQLALPDPAAARTLLREIDDIARRRPDLGILNEQMEEVRRLVSAMPAGTAGASTLTTAELRLIPYLHTHLTFPEIAKRLFLSPNTVKTQAISLYRKLGVSSRGDAMDRAEELGLIER